MSVSGTVAGRPAYMNLKDEPAELAQKGFVDAVPRQGAFVAELTEADTEDYLRGCARLIIAYLRPRG